MDFTIDLTKNPWVNTISQENLNEIINNYLNLGFEVSKLAKITVDNRIEPLVEDIKRNVSFSNNVILDKVNSMIDNYNNDSDIRNQTIGELKDSILKLSGKATCSATRGEIGESFVYNILTEYFPNAIIDVKAQTKREADIHVDLNDGTPLIIVESKLYSNAVPFKEVEKFRRDMERHQTPYGVFLSHTSNITKKDKFNIEHDSKFLIYIANTNFDVLNIIYPFLLIREMHKLKLLENKSSSLGLDSIYKDSYQTIVNSASRFPEIIDCLNSLKQDSLESIATIRTQLEKIQFLIMKNDIKIQSIISDISKTIQNKLQDIVEIDKLQNVILSETDLSNIIQTCLTKKYLVTMEFEQIVRQFLEKGYQFIKVDDKYNFKCYQNKDNYCKIKVKKNKISLHFINNLKKHNLKYELCKENFSIFRVLIEEML